MHRRLYESFVEAFDGNDNGIDAYPKDIKPLYQRPFNVFSHINLLNPSWNDNSSDPDSQFLKAVEVVGDAFRLVMNSQVKSWLPARQILLDAYEKPSKFDDRILVLDQFCPWTEHLHSLEFSKNEGLSGESSNNKRRPILYVLFADSMGRSWRVQAVPVSPESFENRNPLPEAWRGLRDDELDSVVGIKDCVFVHRSGFIGAHKTREGAIQMAISALPQTSK